MKRMLLLLLAGVILSFAQSSAQKWDIQHAPGLSPPDPEVAFSAVNANVCWGIKATISFNSRQSPRVMSEGRAALSGAEGPWRRRR
jgi:hypothetical protein